MDAQTLTSAEQGRAQEQGRRRPARATARGVAAQDALACPRSRARRADAKGAGLPRQEHRAVVVECSLDAAAAAAAAASAAASTTTAAATAAAAAAATATDVATTATAIRRTHG